MAETKFKGTTVNTVGDLPAEGAAAPDFTLTGSDLADVKLSDYAGRRVVLNSCKDGRAPLAVALQGNRSGVWP